MKNILTLLSLLVLFIALLPSCNKEDESNHHLPLNDYLPLKVGAKYKYNYSQFYHYIDGGYVKYGECSWKFISMSVDTPFVYQVEQSLTGYTVSQSQIWNGSIADYIVRKDTTRIENQISTLSFEVLNDRRVAFTCPQTKVTLERFIQSDRNDICFTSNPYEQVCLRKNVGITSLFVLPMHGNHQAGSRYTLIEGPTH
jgi:hypothetical protein